ncbi:Tetratricopeptide-like helical [Penicillium cf. viridicatum]|uniref:Tetratricopeptide-like helical n=1 Tax=Penicillium cf. viridicatum TaxID=2972119 RepID=A0A9W9M7E6_9EURO|nr:Tetratricopeptide-like helical [Penicillium cf. viridicatum]
MASTLFYGSNSGLQIGVHTGPINMAQERLETSTKPLSTVPFAQDEEFVSRGVLLRQIREKSLIPGSRIALVGLGGVGKSQLAIEYSHQLRSQSPGTWVFWVHGSNESRFEQSFREIADQVKIPGRQDPQVNIFKLVENWLRDEKIGKWVCILDNIDDDQLLSMRSSANGSNKPLLEYIPKSQNGSVIITSRSREAALRIVDHKGLIEVNPMQRSEALELLQRKLGESQESESQESEQLVDVLEFMPLAIVQAASYIRNRAPRCSVSQYLTDFQKSDQEATKLLKEEAGHVYRDWEAKNSILVTWQISFNYIRQTKPSAADLLSLMSFFDRQGIPDNLVRHRPKANYRSRSTSELLGDSSDGETSESDIVPEDYSDEETSESDTGPDFEDDITTLRDYSFLSISENGTFMMHRLVQLTTHVWLKSDGQIDQWKDKFISTLYDEFPTTGDYENWERCRLLFPHVKSAMSQRPTSPDAQQQWATLLYRCAWYALKSGNIAADAREMASKSREQRIVLLGDEHEEVINSIVILAIAFRLEGRWKDAEGLEVQVIERRKAKLGEDHPDTLASISNLASTFWNQGRWKEAEELEVQVIERRKAKLGEDHPDTLASISNLASTFWNQGRWKEAEELEVQVIERRKAKLGEDHPDTLTSINNLASTFWNQGRWKEAEELEVQVIERRKAKLGEDHPDTLTSINNLALTFWNQGRWKEAEELEVHVIERRKAKLGEDHPDTLTSINNLASTFWSQGRWKETEELEVHVMERRKAKLGEDHPDTLISMSNLACTWKSSGRDAEAIDLLRNCLAKRKQIIGLDHPDTLSDSETLLEWETETPQWEGLESETSQRKGTRSAVKRSYQKLIANLKRR